MNQKKQFDPEGMTTDCPIADAGIAALAQCWDCIYFVEMEGFDVICSHKEMEEEDAEE